MEIIGIIEKIEDKSKLPNYKNVLVVVIDSMNRYRWGVQFRKNLAESAKTLQEGDCIKVSFNNELREDRNRNYYNNIIAKKVERL